MKFILASESQPQTDGSPVFFKWHDRGYAGTFTDMAFWADGVCLNQRYYNEVYWLDEDESAPVADGSYSEEQVREAISLAQEMTDWAVSFKHTTDEIIKQLNP